LFVVFDLDGTLAKVGCAATAETVSLLAALSKKGARIVISSGKPTYYLCGFARQLGLFDAILIGENGAVIQGGIALPPAFFKKARLPERTEKALAELRKKLETEFPDRIWYQPNETALTPFLYHKEDFPAVRKLIEDFLTPEMHLSFYEHSDCFDILYEKLSKGEGISLLSEITSFAAEKMIAVGDFENDYSMFEKVGYSVGINLPDPSRADANFSSIEEALGHILEIIA
jgi:hydroxymethylpyrimidine pyrophosphatase-like HAD family hydrolase